MNEACHKGMGRMYRSAGGRRKMELVDTLNTIAVLEFNGEHFVFVAVFT